MKDLGIPTDHPIKDRMELLALGINIRVGPIDHDTYVFRQAGGGGADGSRKDFFLVIKEKLTVVNPAALAPLLGHELSHIKDRRDAASEEEILAATERRGFLIQTHIAEELLDGGLLPSPSPDDKLEEAKLVLRHRYLMNVWEGKSLPPNRYGKIYTPFVIDLNISSAKNPGLPALLAYGDLKHRMKSGHPLWDADRENLSPYVQKFDQDLAQEDRVFRKKLALAKKEKAKSVAKEAASLARAARMPADAAETLAAIAKKACDEPARIGPSDLESLHSWFPNPGHDIPSSDRVGASLAGCQKEMYELLVAYHHAWRPELKVTPEWVHANAVTRLPAREDPVHEAIAAPPLAIDWSAAKLATLARKACASPGSIGGRDMEGINDWFPNPDIPDTKLFGEKLSGCAKELYLELLEKNRTHAKGHGLNYEWVIHGARRISEQRARQEMPPPRAAPAPRHTPAPRRQKEREAPRGESGPECMKTRCVPL
jgi:hypothetical protein